MYQPKQQSYAPATYYNTHPASLNSTINLDEVSVGCVDMTDEQEVKLATTSSERELYESLAEVYSIIVTLDTIEKAYLKDSINEAEYTETCRRLLMQYKSTLSDTTVSNAFKDVDSFMQEWDVCMPVDVRSDD
jgi:ESCRT-I complex subunit VPS28